MLTKTLVGTHDFISTQSLSTLYTMATVDGVAVGGGVGYRRPKAATPHLVANWHRPPHPSKCWIRH